MKTEDQWIRKIKGGMVAIKNKVKTTQEANLAPFFLRLRVSNIGMYEELIAEYKIVLESIKPKI